MGKIIFIVVFFTTWDVCYGQEEQSLLVKGNELYKKQQYDRAAEEFQKAADLNAKNPTSLFNLGNALYKSKKPEAAQKAFDDAAENATEATGKSKATYNKGVTL